MKCIIPCLLLLAALLTNCSEDRKEIKPIELNKTNPHYFDWEGQPTVLITSGEHYGAVLNLDFDYNAYLQELHRNGLNLTRLFSGAYCEPAGSFNIAHNTLAPDSGKFICPWARSSEGGYAGGGNKFDLTKWDPKYFARLKAFVSTALDNGVIVEFTLFCPFYGDEQWNLSPMNEKNNVNQVGEMARTEVYTYTQTGDLLPVQEQMIRKVVKGLKSYPNVMYEICNEPYFGGVTMQWQEWVAQMISMDEDSLAQHHLITQNIANFTADIGPHPDAFVSVYNFHYASPPVAVATNYHLNKVIGNNETGFKGNADSTYRKQGWQLMMAGAGLYNNLDYSFTTDSPDGNFTYPSTQPGGGSRKLRDELGYLKDFMDNLDFIHMKPDSMLVTGGLPPGHKCYGLAEPGKEYAGYIFGGHELTLQLNIPEGDYRVEWVDPITNSNREGSIHSDGSLSLQTPPFEEDLAFRIKVLGQ